MDMRQNDGHLLRRCFLGKALLWTAALAAGVLAGGCGIGPPLLSRDRLDYQVSLSESWKRQMLLNIIKTRYADAPVFLEVTSIINQHSLEGSLNASGSLFGPTWGYEQGYGGAVRGYDRPTITYSPLTGAKFAQSLMSPIPPATILAMVQSGWPVDFVLRLTCESVNGVRNVSRSAINRRQADPEFEELLTVMRRIQVSNTIAVRIERKKNVNVATVLLGRKPTKKIARDVARVREILGIEPGTGDIRVAYGAVPSRPDELALLSRSMLQILVELGGCVDVPADHLAKGRAAPATKGIAGPPFAKIHSGRSAPADAAAAVAYKGHWFWIDDGDFASKRTLSLLMMFFSLTETGSRAGPVVTVQAG